MVDEVQNLSIAALEELRMLSNITIEGRTPLQTILLGQPQFRRILASPDLDQLRQRVLAAYHLGDRVSLSVCRLGGAKLARRDVHAYPAIQEVADVG